VTTDGYDFGMLTAPALQLLGWVAERDRTYAETIDVWKSSCPRLTVWEDALAAGLLRIDHGAVVLTDAGLLALDEERQPVHADDPS
jgi:hypothetical protein